MKKRMRKRLKGLAVSTLAFGLLATPYGGTFAATNQPTNVMSNEAVVKLKLMETTDVHGSLMDHDYYSDVPAKNGLVRVATAVNEEREENPNNLLFDNGDILQGNPFTDYIAKINRPTFVNRLEGDTRYQTAVQISKQGWDSAETVIIVRGDDFADALAASPLAYKYNAPILLTQTDELHTDTKKEINRLGATKAIVVGGKSAVSNRVTNALSNQGLWIKRLSGSDRFETAAVIATELGSTTKKAVLVNGRNFADAISVASYAAKNGLPILLTETNALPSTTMEALQNTENTILVGGTAVINEAVEKAVKNPQRLAGQNRFETSLKVATELDSVQEKVFISTGWGFADALAGSVLAAKEGAPVILVDNKGELPANVEELVDSKYVTILGGESAVAEGLIKAESNPIYEAMNLLDYDAATLGNHEFNYGLDFLTNSIKAADFPIVNSNVYKDDHDNDPANNKNLVKPYKIIKKVVKDETGKEQTLKVGVIGFVPPQIMQWDKANLEGKVVTENIVASAEKWIPQMKEDGADIIVTLAHTGFVNSTEDTENAVLGLSKVPGVNAILYGHSHLTFPTGNANDSIAGVTDSVKGTINGVPAVQAKVDGSHLGIIDLTLAKVNGKWTVQNSQSEVRSMADVKPDPEVVESLTDVHEETIEYINSPVGETTAPINSFFSRVQDDPSVQIVNNAQKDYIEKALKGSEYENLPVLSAAAPFKGGRNGAGDFTNMPAGTLTIKNVADLYKYANTVQAVLLNGKELKDYLEWTTTNFNQIDPTKTEEQDLLNPSFPVYNFDIIDGVTYEVDVTQPARYDAKGAAVTNPDTNRIKNLEYNGQPVTDDMQFVIATNNYRAAMAIVGGGKKIIYASPDENRQVVMNYIRDNKVINPSADKNWLIAPISGDVNVTFQSSPLAKDSIQEGSNISATGKTNEAGFGIYNLELSSPTVKVQLLGLNDLHGQLDTDTKLKRDGLDVLAGSMEYTAAAIRQREAANQNTLLVNAGDMIGGSPLISALFQDEPTVEVMESLGMDVGTLGNHEFDEGIAELHRMINGGEHAKGTKGYDGMNFPVIAANAYDKSTGELITGKPYVIKEVDGQKIGFIGVITQETPDMIVTKGNENLQITDEVEAIDKYTAELKEQGIEAVVVLAHNPTNQNGYADLYDATKIAENVNDEVDVIFAAHNHAFNDKVVDNKLIVQAYSYGSAFSDVDLEIDPATGEIIKKEAEVVTVYQADYTPDPAVTAIMKKYEDLVAPMKAEVVGNNAALLEKAYPSTATEFGDNGLGNLLADGMKAAMNSDFALMNGGGVRAALDAGEVTFGDLFSIQPFGNVLNKINLSGADLREVLNKQITGKGLDFHIAGFKYTYTYDSTALTGQVVDIFLPDGSKIDPAKEYSVVVNNYMYGNQSYGILPLATGLEVGPVDLDATVDFVKSLSEPIDYKAEGRIIKVTQ